MNNQQLVALEQQRISLQQAQLEKESNDRDTMLRAQLAHNAEMENYERDNAENRNRIANNLELLSAAYYYNNK